MASNTTTQLFIPSKNQIRRHFLPVYSHINDKNDLCLLLANIPQKYLTEEQFNIRRDHGYHQPTVTLRAMNDVEKRLIYLSRLWNINYSILNCNLQRLIRIANLYGANRIHRFSMPSEQVYLNEYDSYLALEFFLQIDKHMFYMKTCTYGGATRSLNEKSLLAMYEPQARYGMTQCQQTSCCLCHPLYKLTYRMDTPVVQFGPYQHHEFVNHYRSILNCPATCTTKNIIYVLTCPCKQVHYIGETSLSLPQRLSFHQRHGNRIIQEFLLGKENINRIRGEMKSNDVLTKDSMALYRHSTQCSFAMQWFLDENPEYWPFIPTNNDQFSEISADTVNNWFDDEGYVPQPPANYHFTYQQKLEINQFFHDKKYQTSPNLHLDLYQAAIVAILPYFGSDAVRRFIEALFITHTDAQLNSDGHLDTLLYPDVTTVKTTEHIQNQHCLYEKLVRRPA